MAALVLEPQGDSSCQSGGLLTRLGIVCPAGVPKSTAAATLTATYNNLDSVRELFAANKGEIAGVILEPVVGNSGFIVPTQEFLEVCVSGGRVALCGGGQCLSLDRV